VKKGYNKRKALRRLKPTVGCNASKRKGRINNLWKLDVHESMHRDTTMKITNKMHYID
jgi:hypothetical protein